MMKAEKTLVKVNKGQDAYSVIGNYISNHITAIEDMIAVIQINGCLTNQLYMVDVEDVGNFYWEKDWWEGEEDIALIDFFPVNEAERPQEWIPCSERLPEDVKIFEEYPTVIFSTKDAVYCGFYDYLGGNWWAAENYKVDNVVAWKHLQEPYEGE